jgi:hypothetical protein
MGGFDLVRFDGSYLPYLGYVTLTDARDITDHPFPVLVSGLQQRLRSLSENH